MRVLSPSFVLSAALLVGLSGGVLLAQDQSQPADGAAPAATAQATPAAHPHKAPNPHRQAKRMAKKLGLSPDQQSKIESILADREQQVQTARADTTLAPADRRAKIHSIQQDTESSIEANLNDTQKQQYEQIKQNRQAKKQQQAGSPSNS